MNKFMKVALAEAKAGMKNNHGGPFGAVVVLNNKIISQAHNQVIKTNDPTAHAEVLAIREASQKLNRFDLSDCELYTTCEPCPMCFAAMHWAKITKMYYGCNREDAAKIEFDDKFIYDVIQGKAKKEQIYKIQINRQECLQAFKDWMNKQDRVQY